MAERAIARRYAEAFVQTSEASGRLEENLQDLQAIARTYEQSIALRRFLGSPEIGPEEKTQLTHRLWADSAREETVAFLKLLLKKERVDHLPLMAEEAVAVAEARQGILRGEVTTAHPISLAETGRLAGAVGQALRKKVILERRVDPKVLGGVRVKVGTTLLDGSVRARLEQVRRQLKRVKVN